MERLLPCVQTFASQVDDRQSNKSNDRQTSESASLETAKLDENGIAREMVIFGHNSVLASLLLALEIALPERAATDRDGPQRPDPADERGESSSYPHQIADVRP